ncbi:MAG: hypothetical protein ABI835_14725, partial [Chloroflexota bacterium]
MLVITGLAGGVSARQEVSGGDRPARDPQALAERFLGYDGGAVASPITPVHRVNDRMEFWVGKTDSQTPVRVQAVLAGATPNIYLWVEAGITPSGNLPQRAVQINQIVNLYRRRDNYREGVFYPPIGEISDPRDLLPIPDIDNDPHLYILFTSNLREDREAVFNPIDSLPVELAPYSNQHEMLYINTSSYGDTLLSDSLYASIIVRGVYRWIMNTYLPAQPNWLTEAFNWELLFRIQQSQIAVENLSAYLQAPDTALTQPPSLTTQTPVVGGQQLLLAYFLQRYGAGPYTDLFLQTGAGIAPFDEALRQHNITDPTSGAPATGLDTFADFVLTNALNFPFGDQRYVQSVLQIPQLAAPTPLQLPGNLSGLSVNQFGAQYYTYTATSAQTVEVRFDGSETVTRLPMSVDRDPADPFYWSGLGDDQNP